MYHSYMFCKNAQNAIATVKALAKTPIDLKNKSACSHTKNIIADTIPIRNDIIFIANSTTYHLPYINVALSSI